MDDFKILFPHHIYEAHLTTIYEVRFTQREITVIACLLNGRRTNTIASFLSISPRTVTTHFRNIMLKLDCNSQDKIISFIEKSPKLPFVRQYYSSFIFNVTFEKNLKDLSKLKRDESLEELTVYWENEDLKKALLHHLVHHLHLAGIRGEIREHSSNHKEHLSKPSQKTVVFFFEKKGSPNLSEVKFIDLSNQKNYYYAVFEIVRALLPGLDFKESRLSLQAQYEALQHPALPIQSNSEKKEMNPDSLPFHFKKIKNAVLIFSVSICFVALTVGTCILAFEGKIKFKNDTTQEEILVRSDLNIPTASSFLHRSELIEQIDQEFNKQSRIRSVALIGIGGAGKTTLAKQYAHQKKESIVWIINAETNENLRESFEKLAEALSQTEDDKSHLREIKNIKNLSEGEAKIILFVKHRIRSHPNWLLIFDNVENFSNIQNYFPQDSNTWGEGKIILTTQDNTIQNNPHIDSVISVGSLSSNQKLDLFSKIMNHGSLHSLTPLQVEETKAFLEHIPPFPLDVSTAAYYLKATKASYTDYLENLEKFRKEFVDTQENLLKETGDYTKTRYGIVTLSLQHIIDKHEDFAELLLLISLINLRDIPRNLLENFKGTSVVGKFIYHLNKYSLMINETSFSSDSNSTFSIHQNTQAIALTYLIKLLNLEANKNLIHQIGTILGNYTASAIDKEDSPKMKLLIGHIKNFLSHHDLITCHSKYNIESELGGIYSYFGQPINAKPLLEESLANLSEYPTKDYNRISRILDSLGFANRELGNYEEAKYFLNKSLEINKFYLPDNHGGTARALLHLGNVYRVTGEYEKAQDLYNQSLTIYKIYLPENTIGIAWVLGALGIIYKEIGKYEKAKIYLKQALEYHIENDIGYGWALAHLGDVYTSLGHYKIAEKYLKKGLVIYKKYVSENGVGYGWTLAHLGEIYLNLSKYEQAKEYLQNGLAIYRKNHTYVNNIGFSWSLAYLGMIYGSLGNYKDAKDLIKKALVVYQKHYGKDHIETMRIIRALGKAYLAEGSLEMAEKYLHKALDVFQTSKHPDVYIIFEDFAELNLEKSSLEKNKGHLEQSQNFKTQAILNLEQALEIINAYFPKDSPHIERIQFKLKSLK